MSETLDRFIREIRGRLDSMVTRAVINLVNDRLKTQRVQLTILEGEPVDDVEHLQPYGLSFMPPPGSEALALAVSGDRSHTVAICAGRPGDRPTSAKPGTGGLYTEGEWRLFIDPDGVLHLGAEVGSEEIGLGRKTDAEIARIWQVLTTWVPIAQDGGKALQTAAQTAKAGVQSVRAQKVRAT